MNIESTDPDDVRHEGRSVGKLLLAPALNPYPESDPRHAIWLEGFDDGQSKAIFGDRPTVMMRHG